MGSEAPPEGGAHLPGVQRRREPHVPGPTLQDGRRCGHHPLRRSGRIRGGRRVHCCGPGRETLPSRVDCGGSLCGRPPRPAALLAGGRLPGLGCRAPLPLRLRRGIWSRVISACAQTTNQWSFRNAPDFDRQTAASSTTGRPLNLYRWESRLCVQGGQRCWTADTAEPLNVLGTRLQGFAVGSVAGAARAAG